MKNRGPLLVLFCYFLFGILPIYWKIFVTMDPYFILTNRVVWSLLFADASFDAPMGSFSCGLS